MNEIKKIIKCPCCRCEPEPIQKHDNTGDYHHFEANIYDDLKIVMYEYWCNVCEGFVIYDVEDDEINLHF